MFMAKTVDIRRESRIELKELDPYSSKKNVISYSISESEN